MLSFWTCAAECTSVSDDAQGVARLIARDPAALLLAERDGELVGTVIAGFDGSVLLSSQAIADQG